LLFPDPKRKEPELLLTVTTCTILEGRREGGRKEDGGREGREEGREGGRETDNSVFGCKYKFQELGTTTLLFT
jgi:hypothetical protein